METKSHGFCFRQKARIVFPPKSGGKRAIFIEAVQCSHPALSSLSSSTPPQLGLVNDLHRLTLEAENEISARMATLQEDIADKPLLPIIRDLSSRKNGEGAATIEGYAESLSSIMVAAVRLRVQTVKEMVMGILTPLYAVELLASAKS